MATIQTPPNPFKVGDTVYVKSAINLKMTVLIVYPDKLNCTYYNPITGKFDKQDFPITAMRKPT